MPANYRYGSVLMVPHTPSSAVAAGDVVVVDSEIRIAHSPIAANEAGELAAPAGTAVYEIQKLSSDVVTDGLQLYWDAGNTRVTITASTHKKAGRAVGAAGAGVTTCYVRHTSV